MRRTKPWRPRACTAPARTLIQASLMLMGACSFHSLDYLDVDGKTGGVSQVSPGDHSDDEVGGAGSLSPRPGGGGEDGQPLEGDGGSGDGHEGPGGGEGGASPAVGSSPASGGTSSSTGGAGSGGASGGTAATTGGSSAGSGAAAPVATCSDRKKNGAERDVDCGGGACPACADGADCVANADCVSAHCASGSCAAPTSCTGADCPPLVANATYIIHPRHDPAKCADDRGRNLFNGADVIQYACNGQKGQEFVALDRGGGVYALRNVLNGKCLEVEDASMKANAAIELYSCNYAAKQLWQVSATTDGFLKLVAQHSGLALDVEGAASKTSDLSLVQNAYDGSLDMQWKFERIE